MFNQEFISKETYEDNNQSLTEYLSIKIDSNASLPSFTLINIFNMFRNITTLDINFSDEFNTSDLIYKIHLPNLKKLEINKSSELLYFIRLNSLQYIRIIKFDEVDYSTIDTIFDPKKVI